MKNQVSSFWLNSDWDDDDIILDDGLVTKKKGKDPIKLAAYRRAVSNFVRIVTGEDIPVRFTTDGFSMTDGKEVIISATLDDKKFDSAVGLALHEGSHCKLTDFDVIRRMNEYIQSHEEYIGHYIDKHDLSKDVIDKFYAKSHAVQHAAMYVKDLINVIEDRRIDAYIYRNAPGYRGYYQAMYDKFFNDKIIDKGLQSDEYRTEDWESYLFRIINITNPHRDLDALEALRDVWNMIDLKNIDRLKSTDDVLKLAWEIFVRVEECIPPREQQEGPSDNNQDDTEEKQEGTSQDGSGNSGDGGDDGPTDDDGSSAEGSEIEYDSTPGDVDNGLNDKQLDKLRKAMQKQKDFLDGDAKKTRISRKLEKSVRAMEEAGIEQREVEYQSRYNRGEKCSTDVIIVRNFNRNLIKNLHCDMWSESIWYGEARAEAIANGLRMGAMLGKKLKIRAEERDTKYNRRRTGRIDKRMIANAGFGVETIFERIESFAYRPGIMHLSIDNSGSMSGAKMNQAILTATAIAKACSMIDNMDCVISFRAGASVGVETRSWDDMKPVMLIAYDSRKQSINEMRNLLHHVNCTGNTPEGLCFDAMMKEIINDSNGKDSYFVNFSDGEPAYGNYYGEEAHKHTKKQVKKMRHNGIKVLSYFIDHSQYESSMDNFRAMYGKDASFVNTKNVNEVAKTMNNKFLETN